MTTMETSAPLPPIEERAEKLVKRLVTLGVKLKRDPVTRLARIPEADLYALSVGDIIVYALDPGAFTEAAIKHAGFVRRPVGKTKARKKGGKA